jgi:hypothetical protein
MALGGKIKSYGVRLLVTPANSGSAVTIERATNSGFSTALTTVFQQSSGVIQGVVIRYSDLTGNTGTTYWYRAYETKTGYAQSSNSASVNSAPYDLGSDAL